MKEICKQIKKNTERKFAKEQFLTSKLDLFRDKKDALAVVIGDDEEVSIDEAKKRLKEYMEVKQC